MTAAGELKLRRVYFECPACLDCGFPLDDRLGVEGRYSREAEWLQAGRCIDSGQVEGGCKNMIGRRLKQTGARWRVCRVNRQAGLCSLMYRHLWNPFWEAP